MSGTGGTVKGITGEQMSWHLRPGRGGISLGDESGQIMVFFVLILFTLLSFSALVINVGQILARKALAQKLADIGALAGAGEQASSLNIITDINDKSFKLLRWTGYVTRVIPFDLRVADEDRVKLGLYEVEAVFVGQLVNAYDELGSAPGKAAARAGTVTAENAGYLFPGEAVVWDNPDPDPPTYLGATVLYEPTTPHQGTVYWGYFTSSIPCPIWGCNVDPITWGKECARYYSFMGGDTDSFTFDGTYFTRSDVDDEIHFYWRVTVPGTGPILGIAPSPLPAVTAVAKAKPYGGYSGEPPSTEDIEDIWAYSWPIACTCPPWLELNNVWSDIEIAKVDTPFQSIFKAKLDAIMPEHDQDFIDWLNTNYDPMDEVIH